MTADSIVQATDSPINVNLAIHARQSAYRSYVTGYKIPKVGVEMLAANVLAFAHLHVNRQIYCRSTHNQMLISHKRVRAMVRSRGSWSSTQAGCCSCMQAQSHTLCCYATPSVGAIVEQYTSHVMMTRKCSGLIQ